MLLDARLDSKRRFSDKEIVSIQKELARYDTKLKKSELLALLLNCGDRDKQGNLINGFSMFEIASAFSLSNGAPKSQQFGLM